MKRPDIRIMLAFATLYIVWGSTYLAIRIAVEVVPPFLLSGARFAFAGAVLLALRLMAGSRPPTRRELLGAAGVGVFLVVMSNVAVVWAEQTVASGVVALFAAGTPLLIAVFNGHRTGAPLGRQRAVGLALGTAGILLLGSATFQVIHNPWTLVILGIASVSWAIGSTFGRDLPHHPDHFMASALQMLTGGLISLGISAIAGEVGQMHGAHVGWPAIAAWSYLAIAGSLLAFPIFQWLLRVADATAVSSYTYVNPVVALILGTVFLHEQLTPRMIVATMMLLPAVALVVTGGVRAPD